MSAQFFNTKIRRCLKSTNQLLVHGHYAGVATMLSGIIFLISCSSDSEGVDDNFDRSAILINQADNLIIPSYETFQSTTKNLLSDTETFLNTPSANDLLTLRNTWLDARLSWKACEPYGFGPIESLNLETSVDLWPTNVSALESAIINYDGTDDYLIRVGSDKKGFAAIEYLIFGEDEEILTLFENENRRAYLNLLVLDLEDITERVLSAWQSGYRDEFVSNTGNDAGASTTLLSNDFIQSIEETKNFRVATPLGLRTGSDVPLPNKVESYFAFKSKELIIANIKAISTIYTGGAGVGFDDYLDALNVSDEDTDQPLSEVILAQMNLCVADAEAIQGTLQEALEGEKEAVEKLFVDLQQLTVLVKTDMMSQLGLLVVYSDNDGD